MALAFYDDTEHDAPMNFSETRIVVSWGMSAQVPGVLQGDVAGAYVKSPLKGRTIYGIIDESLLPPHLKGKFRKAVVPLRTALYGLGRADKDWPDYRHSNTISAGWKDVVKRKTYVKYFHGLHILCGVYVDDLLIAGMLAQSHIAYKELHELLGFGEPTPQRLSHFIGVDYSDVREKVFQVGIHSHRVRQMFCHQTSLTTSIIQRYKDSTGFTKLRSVATPGFSSDNMAEKKEDDIKGKLSNEASSHVSGVQYLARGTRPDVQETASSLARNFNQWSRLDDRRLHRLMSYLEGTKSHGKMLQVDIDADGYGQGSESMSVRNYVDSDHGGCLRTARSTSGCHAELRNSGLTRVLIDHWSKIQSVAAISTGEAEITAAADGIKRTGLPMQQLIEDVYGHPVLLETMVDDSAALQIGLTGNTKNLKYLAKHQRVKHGFVNDTRNVQHKDRKLNKVDTKENLSDLQTKPLDRLRHEELVQMINMKSMEEYLALVCVLLSEEASFKEALTLARRD